MAEWWQYLAVLAGLSITVLALVADTRARRARVDKIVETIEARGTLRLALDAEGRACCPHCGASLVAEQADA